MNMNRLLKLARYMAPAEDDGAASGSGTVDRGDELATEQAKADPAPATSAEPESSLRGAADETVDNTSTEDGKTPEASESSEKADTRPKGNKMIPLDRHQAILEKERERREQAESRLKQYQGAENVAATNAELAKREESLAKLEAQYNKELVDGETEKATALMRQIRGLDREIAELKAESKLSVMKAQTIEQMRYDTTLERIEEAYPELNPASDEYDEGKERKVARIANGLRLQGDTPAAALQEAVKLVMGEPQSRKQVQATQVEARVDAKEADKVAKERAQQGAKRTADAISRQPSSMANAGADTDKMGGGISAKDVSKMSQDEFMKLPEDVLSRMRGDVIA